MAFPGTYNFAYYRGDTLEFNVYPKTSNGDPFDLDSFDNAVFTAATRLGATGQDLINLTATFAPDRSYINCKITPSTGLSFIAGTEYFYDLQINDGVDIVYTILRGSITVTEQVSPNPVAPAPVAPSVPTNLVVTEDPEGTIKVDWTAPSGVAPTEYRIYGKVPELNINDYILIATVDAPTTEYSADSITVPILGELPLEAGIEYFIKVTSFSSVAGLESVSGAEDTITLALPETVPGIVQNLAIDPDSRDFVAGTATITWNPPASGATVTSYAVAYNDSPELTDGPEDFTPVLTPIPANVLTYTFSDLTPATPYAFAVIAYAGTEAGTPAVVVDGV